MVLHATWANNFIMIHDFSYYSLYSVLFFLLFFVFSYFYSCAFSSVQNKDLSKVKHPPADIKHSTREASLKHSQFQRFW